MDTATTTGPAAPPAPADGAAVLLPALDQPCTHCTGPGSDAEKAAADAAWAEWNTEEHATQPNWSDFQEWRRSGTWRELQAREPERLPDKGCVECDWLGRVPTDAGRVLLAFLRVHQEPR